MPLPKDFPEAELLEKQDPPYETVEDVKEATDEELLSINGIGTQKLERIREVAPYTPSPDEQGTGATSGSQPPPPQTPTRLGAASDPGNNPNTADDLTRTDAPTIPTQPGGGGVSTAIEAETVKGREAPNSVQAQGLPEGVHMNERGTVTATSGARQPDIVSPEQAEAQRRTEVDRLRRKMQQVFDV